MAWRLDKIDEEPRNRVLVENVLRYAKRELEGERLGVVEETAKLTLNQKPKRKRGRKCKR